MDRATPPYVLNKGLIEVLRQAIDLPEFIVSLTITMECEKVPVIDCTYHPVKNSTTLDSTAVTHSVDHAMPETKRFGLHELP